MSTREKADYVLLVHHFDEQIHTKGAPVEYRRHHRGDVLTLDGVEAARLLKAKAIEPAEVEAEAAPAEEADEAGAGAESTSTTVERPANTATTVEWVEYAVSQGLDRSEMEKLKRAEIIAAVQ
ncbi:hypothetical protein [Williamsia sp.]|uniref:hypothetical protein n=1 Tax=Williamsia sp. TaxID=1872085 RepID=UPI002F934EA5